ncbi:hypothetical protein L6452_27409 [Arctium lappa]|uniref:Uncharacterized protein n=1 Tax=Arctium lappa TaxID=4217 RepID=A0ACB8ZWJ1_ARCLA|nr:hypothetical protein L6452_27409 [Arctium lappa]
MSTISIPHQYQEVCICKSFGATLTGSTLQWLIGLKPKSIGSFAELVNYFSQQFASSRKMEKQTSDLYYVVQKAGETIQSYFNRFNAEMISVRNCDIKTAIEAYKRDLDEGSGSDICGLTYSAAKRHASQGANNQPIPRSSRPKEELELELMKITFDQDDLGDLHQKHHDGLIVQLKDRATCFTWTHEDMVDIDPEVISHKLNVDPSFKPIKQKHRKFATERNKVINDEVDNLLKIGKIREVKYPDWLANVVVVVQKKNGKWRVCIDFTDLNKACPKDPFPLPHINALVDATAGHELLKFMDAYSGYNQILMHVDDQEKTTFMTDNDIYCYKVMPFSLENASSTY